MAISIPIILGALLVGGATAGTIYFFKKKKEQINNYDLILKFKFLKDNDETPIWEFEGEEIFDNLIDISVAFSGDFNTGKTYILNKILESDFVSRVDKHTEDFSIKLNNQICYIDSQGSNEVKEENLHKLEVMEKRDKFIEDILFRISDFKIFVTDKFDQPFFKKLYQYNFYCFKEKKENSNNVIVYNLKNFKQEEIMPIHSEFQKKYGSLLGMFNLNEKLPFSKAKDYFGTNNQYITTLKFKNSSNLFYLFFLLNDKIDDNADIYLKIKYFINTKRLHQPTSLREQFHARCNISFDQSQ